MFACSNSAAGFEKTWIFVIFTIELEPICQIRSLHMLQDNLQHVESNSPIRHTHTHTASGKSGHSKHQNSLFDFYFSTQKMHSHSYALVLLYDRFLFFRTNQDWLQKYCNRFRENFKWKILARNNSCFELIIAYGSVKNGSAYRC